MEPLESQGKQGLTPTTRKPGLRLAGAKIYKAGKGIAPWATIIAALVAILSFFYGYRQFRETQELQRTTLNIQKESLVLDRDYKAVELMVKYNDLMREVYSKRGSPKVEGAFWRDQSAIVMAESIFQLVGEDKGWRETVRWMLENHTDFLKDGLDCPTYDEKFIQFVNQVVKCDVCTPDPCSP